MCPLLSDGSRVNDVTPPLIMDCPQDIVRQGPAGGPRQFVSWTAPTASDTLNGDSGIRSSTDNVNYETQRTVNVGQIILVQYTFVDAVGNTAYCAFSIKVESK